MHLAPADGPARVPLATVAREWTRIGCVGFGGPPAHISLLRRLCVTDRGWLSETEFEDGVAATNLLPGPASTQLAIFCAWRVHGPVGALVGGCCFIAPGLALILVLAALFLGDPPRWVQGAAAGAGAAVAAVAVSAAIGLLPASWARAASAPGAGSRRSRGRVRWSTWLLAGGVAGALTGAWVVLLLAACGLLEVALSGARDGARGGAAGGRSRTLLPLLAAPAVPGALGGLGALVWVALKVGLLSYGGGFVIIPLMQGDAVDRFGWMSDGEFLNAVALGQVTPGPVVHTVAVVGYAAAGVGGGLLAALVAFAPSFAFVLLGASRFDRLRADRRVRAFLTGAGAAAIGAIAGSAVPLALAVDEPWQWAVLAAAALWLLVLRRGVVSALLAAGALGVLAAAGGLDLPA